MRITIHSFDCSAEFRAQLDDLMQEVFSFTFAAWHQSGAWNTDYTSHAVVEGGRVISNACVYRMDLLVGGQKQEAFQIGAVATRKEHRGEGLSRRILQSILDQHPGGTFFLFANPSVLDFYPRFGFRMVRQNQPCLRLSRPLPGAPGTLRKLSSSDLLSIGLNFFKRRTCFSHILDCANAAPINFFNLLYEYPQIACEIPALQALLIAEQQGSTLMLIDVCATRPLTFLELLPYLDFPGADTIHFAFNPDWLIADYDRTDYEEDGAFFVRGPLDIDKEFIVPWMIKT